MSVNTQSRWSLKGKKVLVTGGTRGIGKAIVCEFLELGAEVFFVSRDKADIEKEVASYKSDSFPASGMTCDVTSGEERKKLFETIAKSGRDSMSWSTMPAQIRDVRLLKVMNQILRI